jgi:hypothetical protein
MAGVQGPTISTDIAYWRVVFLWYIVVIPTEKSGGLMALEKELEAFKKELPRLVAESQGKFALVQGDSVVGAFDTYEDAVKAGYDKFSLTPFMVKRIAQLERVQYFSRDLSACHK